MQLLAVGLDHHRAPLALRERIAVTGDRIVEALAHLRARASEGFVLSTCNRTEYYAVVGHAETGTVALVEALLAGSGVTAEEIEPYLDVYSHDEAVRHLFRVAAGLESMVPGEDQILAQLKGAVERAGKLGVLGATTHRLGASALASGKRVRAGTGIARHALSIVSVALQMATDTLGSLEGRRVLVLGAGSTAELALKHLAGRGVASVTVTGRSPGRALTLAQAYGAATSAWSTRGAAMVEADLVLCCTSAPTIVVTADDVASAIARRGADVPLAILDLAVPRDVSPAAGELAGVQLWDIDDLQAICDENRERRAGELARAEAITESEVERFMQWWSARELAPTITALVRRAESIRDAELARLLPRLTELSERDEEQLRAFAALLVNKLLHEPITVLKDDPEGANMAAVVRALFALDSASDADDAPAAHAADAVPSCARRAS
jgi:glutamyl-tRNA reductase